MLAPSHYVIGFYFKLWSDYLQWCSRLMATTEAAMPAKQEDHELPVSRRIGSRAKRRADAGRRMVEQAMGLKQARKGTA